MAYAIVADVEARLGRPLSTEETALVNARLDDIELMIKARIPDLVQKITDGELDEDVVKLVEVEAVLRLIRNPNGFTQETDGNYSYMMSSEVASGRLDILASEWALLGVRQTGMFIIAPFMERAT